MENPDLLDFKVGQLAEMKSFLKGFRGAWFRCKIIDISLEKNKIKLEYYDFPGERRSWSKIYQVPPYGRMSMRIKKQLMVRPQYPLKYHKSEMPPVNSISEVCVIIDGTWNVGDLVDWLEDHCYWSVRVIKVLSNDKVQIKLPMTPAGEGGTYVAFCKDLRPSLDWSPREGWTLPTVEGQISCSAQLIFPSKQGMDSEMDEDQNTAASPLNASSMSRVSVSLAAPIERDTETQTSEQGKDANRIVCQEPLQSQDVKMDDYVVESITGKASSSDGISTLRVQESKADATWEGLGYLNDTIDLNIMHEDTLEALILDLEELANRIKWIKNQLHSDTRSSWKFMEHRPPSASR